MTPSARRVAFAAVATVVLVTAMLTAAAVLPDQARAKTVSGTVKHGAGYRILLVQANGTVKKAIVKANGAFSIPRAKLGNASLQLVRADGSYFGPVVLRATTTKAFLFIKGSASLKVGTVVLKSGFGRVSKPRLGRYQTLATRTAKAASGRPVGAGRLGRVRTARVAGLNGPGADLDLDGVVSAFDIDDNGNLILDNVDRTRRGASRPRAAASAAAAHITTRALGSDETLGPPPLTTPGQLFMFSNFWPAAVGPWTSLPAASINANIGTIKDLDALIDLYLPMALHMGVVIPAGERATLDGLGNSYLRAHTVAGAPYAGVTYPLVGASPGTFTPDGLLELVAHGGWSEPIAPGALAADIAPGDCVVQTAADGTQYPATLNFVFNTAPALKSYRFDTDTSPTDIVYDENGCAERPGGVTVTVPTGASRVTLTFWRPQRKAAPAEPASAAGWVDIGGLWYYVDIPGPPRTRLDDPGVGTCDTSEAITDALANGTPVPPSQWKGGVLDPAVDLPSDPANTISFTFDMAKCFSGWATLPSRAWFQLGLKATAGYGDNAMTGLWFELE